MNKAIIPALAASLLMFVLMGLGGNSQEPTPEPESNPSMAVVRLEELYMNSAVGKAAIEHMNKIQEMALGKLGQLQTALEEAQQAEDEEKVESLQIELQSSVYMMQNLFNGEQQRLGELVQASIKQGLDKLLADKGLDIILDESSAQAWSKQVDLTDEALIALDQIAFDLGEVPSLEAPAAALPQISIDMNDQQADTAEENIPSEAAQAE